MIGKAIRTFASNNGFRLAKGVAFGVYRSYPLTLSENGSNKTASYSAHLSDAQRETLSGMLASLSAQKETGLLRFVVTEKSVVMVFRDNSKDLSKLLPCVSRVSTRMLELGVPGCDHCACCGQFLATQPRVVLFDDVTYLTHDACVNHWSAQQDNTAQELKKSGSVLFGFLGALLGALVGSVLWGVLYYAGYIAAVAGLVVGIASSWAYDKLGGRQTNIKILAVILSTVVCIVLAQFIALFLQVSKEVGCSFGTAVDLTFLALDADSELLGEVIKDLLMGLLFAGLGIFGMIARIRGENKLKTGKPEILG